MSNITGDEPVNPFFEYNENGYGQAIVITFADGSKQFLPYKTGETLRQRALREFMSAMLMNPKNGFDKRAAVTYAEDAAFLVEAYINQLNIETEQP